MDTCCCYPDGHGNPISYTQSRSSLWPVHRYEDTTACSWFRPLGCPVTLWYPSSPYELRNVFFSEENIVRNIESSFIHLNALPFFSCIVHSGIVFAVFCTYVSEDHVAMCMRVLTLMLVVANLTNTRWCKNPEKWLKTWHMGTHLRVLSKSYPMNTNMTGFRWKIFASLWFRQK